MANIEVEEVSEDELWAIEVAIEEAERFQAQDASFLPGPEGRQMCRMGRALIEAAAMGSVPRLRKEGMGPMAAEVWGQEELLKLMVPCKSKRCSGSDKGSEVDSQEDEYIDDYLEQREDSEYCPCERSLCRVHLAEPSGDGPIATGFWACAGCKRVWCADCKPGLYTCEVCRIEDKDVWDKIFEKRWNRKNKGVSSDDYDPPDHEDLDDLVPEREYFSWVEGDPTARYCPKCLVSCQGDHTNCTKDCCPAHQSKHECMHVQILCGECPWDEGMYHEY